MDNLISWTELFRDSLLTFGSKFMGALPKILGAVAIIIIGWIIARIIRGSAKKILKLLNVDALANKIKADELLQKANISKTPSEIIGQFLYWIVILLVIITASDALGWNAVTEEIGKLISWMPSLLSAIIFFIVGMYLAGFVRDIITGATGSLGISTGRIVSVVVYYVLAIIVSITALDQAGIDTTVLQSNLILILGSIMLAAAISYGWASRDILSNILATTFGKRTIKVNQVISFEGKKGTVVAINSTNFVLELEDHSKLVIPSSKLLNSTFTIHGDL